MPADLLDAGLPHPARAVFTTRAGGVPGVDPRDAVGDLRGAGPAGAAGAERHRSRLAAALGGRVVVHAEQVHGRGVAVVGAVVEAAAGAPVPGVDALVTAEPGVVLLALAADCVPVLLVAPHDGLVAAAHAGRRGLLDGVLDATVDTLLDLGATSLVAAVGPAAGPCCYEVPAAMRADAESLLPGVGATTTWGTPSLDLPGAAVRRLRERGVTVHDRSACTVHDLRFCSHRRDATPERHAGAVVLVPDVPRVEVPVVDVTGST